MSWPRLPSGRPSAHNLVSQFPESRFWTRMHGSTSTGPRTTEGMERSRRARWKHGLYSAAALAEQKRVRELLAQSRELLKQMQAS
jgi:hypothetical protein